ncbi:MAG: mannose-6-phosphate isomerase, class I [Streptococcaceae bacterium]|nr:mannose-6-phosphate isomerase, class I [Streptococcaceae bacterium]
MSEPLFLKPVFHEKIWGGSKLAKEFGYQIPSEHTGECWAISAHPNGVSTVLNGKYQGMKLDELYQAHPALFGNPDKAVFPLLTKILDANDWLSVQVHPDDTYALEHEGELGKTECWYVIAAEPDAQIIYGHHAKSRKELSEMIASKDWNHLLTRVKVKAGDFFYVPSGTMHAIGKGILILETQQSSDTTYRVYDFDRKDNQGNLRELHLPQSIDVMTIGEIKNTTPLISNTGTAEITTFITNDFFTVYQWRVHAKTSFKQSAPYTLVSVLDGEGELIVSGDTYSLKKGQHFILPSDVSQWEFSGHLSMIASHDGSNS